MSAEQVLLINPRRRRKRKSSRRRARRSSRSTSYRRRRRRLRNPLAFANPRRRRRRSSRRRHRNPMSLGNLRGIGGGFVIPAVLGGGGAVLMDVAYAYGTSYIPLPDALKTGWGATLAKAFGILGIAWVAGRFLPVPKDKVKLAAVSALTVMAYNAIRDQARTALPDVKGLGSYADYVDYRLTQDHNAGQVGAYMQPALGFISPAPVIAGGGMGAYMTPDLSNAAMGNYGDGM
jgi:hypothetical protein